jgi:predicted dehydrogenase
MDRKIRVGVIGLGIMGEQYVRFYQDHPWTEVVAVAARRAEQAAVLAARYGVGRSYSDWMELVQSPEIDAVCIALPDHLHYAAATLAIRNGKHVLIEKPMTTDLAEADELVRLVEESGVKVQVAFNHRWLSSYHQGHTLIAHGTIGAPLFAYARKNDTIYVPTEMLSWAAKTTPAWFLSSHDIDLVCWFFGSEPVEARAWGVKRVLAARGIDTYDMISSQVRFANGSLATFECGWIYPNSFPTIVDSFVEVIGEKGHLHFDRKRESMELSTPEAFTYPKSFLSCEIFGIPRGAYPACLDDFARAIHDDRAPAVGVRDGRRVTAVLSAIHTSLLSGESAPIQPPASVRG